MSPTRLRKEGPAQDLKVYPGDTSTLLLAYRPPYDWAGMLEFLNLRKLKEVEHISGGSYLRTVRLGKHTGWIRISDAPEKHALRVEFTHSLVPVLPAPPRVGCATCLTSAPDPTSSPHTYGSDPPLKTRQVLGNPGLRGSGRL